MSKITIEIEFLAGTDILTAIREAKRKAIQWDVAYVKFKFNETKISVGQKCNIHKAHDKWQKNREEKYFVFNGNE